MNGRYESLPGQVRHSIRFMGQFDKYELVHPAYPSQKLIIDVSDVGYGHIDLYWDDRSRWLVSKNSDIDDPRHSIKIFDWTGQVKPMTLDEFRDYNRRRNQFHTGDIYYPEHAPIGQEVKVPKVKVLPKWWDGIQAADAWL